MRATADEISSAWIRFFISSTSSHGCYFYNQVSQSSFIYKILHRKYSNTIIVGIQLVINYLFQNRLLVKLKEKFLIDMIQKQNLKWNQNLLLLYLFRRYFVGGLPAKPLHSKKCRSFSFFYFFSFFHILLCYIQHALQKAIIEARSSRDATNLMMAIENALESGLDSESQVYFEAGMCK